MLLLARLRPIANPQATATPMPQANPNPQINDRLMNVALEKITGGEHEPDGNRVIAVNSALIREGKIVRVGRNLSAPPDSTVIDVW